MTEMANFIQKRGLSTLLTFLAWLNAGESCAQIGQRLGVSESRVVQWKNKFFDQRYCFTAQAEAYLEHEEQWQTYLVEQNLQSLREELHHGEQFRLRLLVCRGPVEQLAAGPWQPIRRGSHPRCTERREHLEDR